MNIAAASTTREKTGIAIVGMYVRVPGAETLTQFWSNLRTGVESITFFSDDELRASGVDETTLANPHYVKAMGQLPGIELFDATFFNLTPREVEILDPQHRLLLKGVWRALEHAAIDPERYAGRIGLFAGVGLNGYLLHNLINHPELLESVGGWQLTLSNDKDFATSRVAYKLNLQGPAVTLNTACSTSLVATVMAAQSLLSHQCDVVIAGGCSIHLPQDQGYFHIKGGTLSPDGHCRPFDRAAAGTIDGNGCAVVVLKRITDAIADGDSIHGVIRGFAINNDGSLKVGYSAPSVAGQAEVILEALEIAGLGADTIDYVETHGTATELGDSVEISALTEAFRASSQRVGDCAIGSLKGNIGHLDTAAGTASLIKTVLALNAGEIPPTCHFQVPNPKLGLKESPFFVNSALLPWPRRADMPRRAGVSSFGIGGTNAHVIVEESPALPMSAQGRPWVLLPLAARDADALAQLGTELADHIDAHPEQSLADIAHTLQIGRRHFPWRRVLVVAAADRVGASAELREKTSGWQGQAPASAIAPIFLLPGQDAHHVNMALLLYRHEPRFHAIIEHCRQLLATQHGIDLLSLLYPEGLDVVMPRVDSATTSIDPLPLYVINYALAQLWISWGVTPRALVGYSLGEYVAATLAGVVSLNDGLKLAVASRQLLRALKPGRMVAVALSVAELQSRLPRDSYIAMVIGPQQVIVAGNEAAITLLTDQLNSVAVRWRPVPLALPFHTPLMTPFLASFANVLSEVHFHAPQIPYLCSLTGDWITATEATNPQHYLRLASTTVRLDRMLDRLFTELETAGEGLLLEVGPSQVMTALALQHPRRPTWLPVLSSLPDSRHRMGETGEPRDQAHLLGTAGRLWLAGVELDWAALADTNRRRVALPGHPFRYQRFWIDPTRGARALPDAKSANGTMLKEPDISHWFYLPSWRRLSLATATITSGSRWLLIADASGLAERLARALQEAGAEVVLVRPRAVLPSPQGGDKCLLTGTMTAGYFLDSGDPDAWGALFTTLGAWRPQQLVHLALYQQLVSQETQAFNDLMVLGYAINKHYLNDDMTLTLVADRLCAVDSAHTPDAAKVTALGPLRVIGQEYPNITTRIIDIDAMPRLPLLLAELADRTAPQSVALRGTIRLREYFESAPLPAVDGIPARLRRGGVYLLTGGLGNIGLALARYLAEVVAARLVLVSRTPLPPRTEWSRCVTDPATPPRLMSQLRQLLAIEALGCELLLCNADVADEAAMNRVFATAEQRFGTIHGIIHAAGLVGQSSVIAFNNALSAAGSVANQRQFPSKVTGTEVLATLLAERQFDFCLICSSLSSLLGGLGFSAYAATNLYVDARVEQLNQRQPGRWLAVNWEGWIFENETRLKGLSTVGALGLEMMPAEGCEAFARLMALPSLERVVISSGDLQRRLAQWVERQPPATASTSRSSSGHARPELLGDYTAPRSSMEQQLVMFCEHCLGIDGIGVDDNFFELGGNSLIMIQLVAKIRRTFQVEISLMEFFERPTVAAMATRIELASSVDEERDEGFL
ncbi:phthiocerol/phenolphthiocerol synthesis type-I polyketide synthase E [Gammaproteobacteria bacterium]